MKYLQLVYLHCWFVATCMCISAAEKHGELDAESGTSSPPCGGQCQKKVLFDVNCSNGEATAVKLEGGMERWVDGLREKVDLLDQYFNSEGSGERVGVLSLEEKLQALETKIDHLLEQFPTQSHS